MFDASGAGCPASAAAKTIAPRKRVKRNPCSSRKGQMAGNVFVAVLTQHLSNFSRVQAHNIIDADENTRRLRRQWARRIWACIGNPQARCHLRFFCHLPLHQIAQRWAVR
jgi:hypothetical protein